MKARARYRSALLAVALLAVVIAAAAPSMAATSVVINPNDSYKTSFIKVDVTANATVTFELSYVDQNNQTVPFLSLSGTSFSYNSSEPLVLTIKNSGTAAVNATFNTLVTDLASSGQATVTGSDRVVKIPVAARAGDKITVTIKSNNDPYSRLGVIVFMYSDGTFERVDGGTYYYSRSYSQFFGSDSDWPASLTDGNYYTWLNSENTFTLTAKKDVSAVIVAISTYLNYKWDISVQVTPASSGGSGGGTTTETTTTTTETGGWGDLLNANVDIFGHKATAASILVVILVMMLLAAVLLRR